MTLQTTNNTTQTIQALGGNLIFLYDYRMDLASDAIVTVDGVNETGYSILGLGDDAGGSVTLLTAPAIGSIIVVARFVPETQDVSYPVRGAFPAPSHENAMDRITMMVQQQNEKTERGLRFPLGDTAEPELADVNARKERFMAFGPDGEITYPLGVTTDAQLRADLANPSIGDALVAGEKTTGNVFTLDAYHESRAVNFVTDFGGVGDDSTDNTTFLQTAIDSFGVNGGTIYFPEGTYLFAASVIINAKSNIAFMGARGSILKWTDGNYIAISLINSSQFIRFENIYIRGTTNVSPQITLIKATGSSSYLSISRCQFAFASTAILLAATYINKLTDNDYSNCSTYISTITSEGANIDHFISGETFGTAINDTSPAVSITGPQTRLVGCYWETQATAAKLSLEFKTGAQQCVVSGSQFFDSGGILFETSTSCSLSGCSFSDCDNTSLNTLIRVDGGANAIISGNHMTNPTLKAGFIAISSSGTITVSGNQISQFDTGASIVSGAIVGNTITKCTTGILLSGGSLGVTCGLNSMLSNTTDINNGGGTNIVALNYASTISESALTGAYFGNGPRRPYVREYYGQATYDWPSILDGTSATTTVTVLNAAIGDFVDIGFDSSLQGMTLTGYVSAADTVTAVIENQTGVSVDLASGLLKCLVRVAI